MEGTNAPVESPAMHFPILLSARTQRLFFWLKDNPRWGYDRIAGALANLGNQGADQTVGDILRRHGPGTAPERRRPTTWTEFIRRHREVLWATDFFTAEIWSAAGLLAVYVLSFIHLQTRKIVPGGLTPVPTERWVKQIARNVTGVTAELTNARYLLRDHDAKSTEGFDGILQGAGIEPIKLPPRSALLAPGRDQIRRPGGPRWKRNRTAFEGEAPLPCDLPARMDARFGSKIASDAVTFTSTRARSGPDRLS